MTISRRSPCRVSVVAWPWPMKAMNHYLPDHAQLATINQNVDVFLNFDDGTATGVPGTLTIPDTAFNDRDYDKDNTPFVTFPAYGGGTQANPGTDLIRYITIDINDDIWTEQDETFTVRPDCEW